MLFPLGKPIAVMCLLALAGGVCISLRQDPPRADLDLWVFAEEHFDDYSLLANPAFKQQYGRSLGIDLISTRSMDMRLPVLFMSPGSSRELPDAVEVAVGSMAIYLRPPTGDIGFMPLNHYLQTTGLREIVSLGAPGRAGWNARLKADGRVYTFDGQHWHLNSERMQPDAWIDRILPARLASSTKNGQIFGVPHDVHPVALAFRDDLFREAGVPLIDQAGNSTVGTWAEFQEKCLQFQKYWQSRGYPTRHAIELPLTNAGILSILLAQRHINLIEPDSSINVNDPRVAQTLAFYVQLVAGDRAIGADAAADSGMEYKDFEDGNFCAVFMPDWKVDNFRKNVKRLAGKFRLIPLPKFDSSDAPTASYGGTLLCIPRAASHADQSWEIAEFLYFGKQSLADRGRLGIVPPIPEAWDGPEYHQPEPYFGGQKSMELYTEWARQVPPAYTTPINTMALLAVGYVQSRAVEYMKAQGPAGLQQQCQTWLEAAAVELQRRIDHARFD